MVGQPSRRQLSLRQLSLRQLSTRKQRYLAALGIDRWVPRRPVPADTAGDDVLAQGRLAPETPGHQPADRHQHTAAAPSASARLDGARQLLEAQPEPAVMAEHAESAPASAAAQADAGGPGAETAGSPATTDHPTGDVPSADQPAPPHGHQPAADEPHSAQASAQSGSAHAATGDTGPAWQPPPQAAAAEAEAEKAPRFSLLLLELGSGLLLVDEAALAPGELRHGQLQLLADLLRTAVLLRGQRPADQPSQRSFFWPQLEDSEVDQSLPRACEALDYFLEQRRRQGTGLILRVLAAASPSQHDQATPRDPGPGERVLRQMADPQLPRVDLDPGVLSEPALRQSAWDRLQSLWRPMPQDPGPDQEPSS